jgi:exonuclease SbcD
MKIIHSSDWHLGRSLYGRKRYDEFEAFLNWLAELIENEEIDALLVAGDIFDNIAPSNRAQELYYSFLCRIASSECRHVVITAGNHDSASFLNASRDLLRFINVHVIGCMSESLADEVLVLSNRDGEPELIVCAVPYLRDRDIRKAEAGESREDKGRKLLEGIRNHYEQVCQNAERIRADLGKPVPIIAMGHLFTTGGQTIDSDGVRDLYVGSLAHVDRDIFPPFIDYVALGHLHIPQKVGGCDNIRYSGSPLPMGFGEARQEKMVCQVSFSEGETLVSGVAVPRFQILESIIGNWDHIAGRLEELKSLASTVWLDVIYEGQELMGDLGDRLDGATAGTKLQILRVKNNRILERSMSITCDATLSDLNTHEVFQRCLDAHEVPETQQKELVRTYNEAVLLLQQELVGTEQEA